MPYSFVLYPTPLSSRVTLTPDGAPASLGQAYTAPDGRPGQVCYVGDTVASGHGAALLVEANGHIPFTGRGFLILEGGVARLQVDDVTLTPEPAAPPTPEPGPPQTGGTPEEIIQRVYSNTRPNLATAAGCGKFTEDCCDALHNEHSTMWGHIAKSPGQNQYNGHAVDALMLLGNAPGTSAGIYDIIFSSASPEAKPAFNYVSPPDYSLWYYPADAATMGVQMVAIPTLRRRL